MRFIIVSLIMTKLFRQVAENKNMFSQVYPVLQVDVFFKVSVQSHIKLIDEVDNFVSKKFNPVSYLVSILFSVLTTVEPLKSDLGISDS